MKQDSLFVNAPPPGLILGRKAVLKPPHSKRWRGHPVRTDLAKRLECGVFTAAFQAAASTVKEENWSTVVEPKA